MRPPTRLVTLNRLVGVASVHDAREAIAVDDTDGDLVDGTEPMRVTADRITVGGRPALWFTFQTEAAPAAWAKDAEITLGRPLDLREQHSGGVLVLDVDERLYAISFGQGFRRIVDGYRDQRFGLRVAVRSYGAEELGEIVGRTDNTDGTDLTAAVLGLQPGHLSDIVRHLGRRTLPLALTHQPAGDRAAKLLGASGLRLRLALRGDDLVRDLRAIAAIHDRPLPLAGLAFVDDVAPVGDARTRRQLDADLEDILSDPDELTGAAGNLAVGVPDSAIDHLDETVSYRISVAGQVFAVPDLGLREVASALADLFTGERVPALTHGQIAPCELPGGRRQLVRPSALSWIEATVVVGERHFALLGGEWYEFDRDLAVRIRREVDEVFASSDGPELPAWPHDWSQAAYNRQVQSRDPRYLCLDRTLVREQEVRHGPGLELCDLLGPENELVHVARARGSSTLSRLFARGLVSWASLRDSPETRRRFRTLAHDVAGGDRLPADYRPERIVFAIAPGDDRPLTPQTLFPFAQAALARAAAELRAARIRVDVVGIPSGVRP